MYVICDVSGSTNLHKYLSKQEPNGWYKTMTGKQLVPGKPARLCTGAMPAYPIALTANNWKRIHDNGPTTVLQPSSFDTAKVHTAWSELEIEPVHALVG